MRCPAARAVTTLPSADFVPWTAAHFQTAGARDRFLGAFAQQLSSEIEVKPMPDVGRGAWVRWRPGWFLDLNDIAYAHGGRIVVAMTHRHRVSWTGPR